MTTEHKEGGCQCGAVRFRTTNQPKRVVGCHCQTCKQRTGSVYGVGVYLAEEEVEFLSGELRSFEFHSSASGRWLRNEFCVNCATAVTWTLELRPGLRGMAGGAYDDPNWFVIGAHIWTSAARSDMCYADHVEVFEEAIPA
jgi:hypothetical protein